MDSLNVSRVTSRVQFSPVRGFDQIAEQRAEQHEHLRGRYNVTSCRSPTRELDTKLLKDIQQHKRHLEFQRRRSVSPDPHPVRASYTAYTQRHSLAKIMSIKNSNQVKPSPNGCALVTSTPSLQRDDPSNSKWALLWSESLTMADTASVPLIKESTQHSKKVTTTEKHITGHKVKRPLLKAEKIKNGNKPLQSERIVQRKTLQETGVQTEPGYVTVKELDVQKLAEYLQEALWREEALKKKLSLLQQSASNLLCSSNKIWTTRCSEDLLKAKIKALESQLHACLQKTPKDGVKKLVLQMEKQKLLYEETALAALQKATQEKAEAVSTAETLQMALQASVEEALKWQGLYEELKNSCCQLKERQDRNSGQIQVLNCQLELSRGREAGLRDAVGLLLQEKEELQYNAALLEEDSHALREEIHILRDGSRKTQDFVQVVQVGFHPEALEKVQTVNKKVSQEDETLRETREKLQLKERECEGLQRELEVMEQECQSCQTRLSQCRDELRHLSHRHSNRRAVPWKRLCVFLVLLLAVAAIALLWFWHPAFRDHVEDIYSDIEKRIEDYLIEMASPQSASCFRPI